MANLLRLRDDALLQCFVRVPYAYHDALRCVCRRARTLAAREQMQKARRAAGWTETALIAGGGSFFYLDKLEALDLENCPEETETFALLSGRWRRMAPMPVGRCGSSTVTVGDEMWCLGGCVTTRAADGNVSSVSGIDEVAIFSPSQNAWRLVSDPEGFHGRNFSATCRTPSGDVILIGGRRGGLNSLISSIQASAGDDPTSWRDMPTSSNFELAEPTSRAFLTPNSFQVGVFDNQLFVAPHPAIDLRSNRGAVQDTSIYDFATGAWRAGPRLPRHVFMPAGVLHGSMFYLIGGMRQQDSAEWTETVPAADVFVLDVSLPRERAVWRMGPELPSPRYGHQVVAHQGRVYVLGGHSHKGAWDTECLNIRLSADGSAWEEVPQLPSISSEENWHGASYNAGRVDLLVASVPIG